MFQLLPFLGFVNLCCAIAANFSASDNGNFIPSSGPVTSSNPQPPFSTIEPPKLKPSPQDDLRKSSKTFSSYGSYGHERDVHSSSSSIHPHHHSGYGADSGEFGVSHGLYHSGGDFGSHGLHGTSGYGGGFDGPVADYHFHEHHGGHLGGYGGGYHSGGGHGGFGESIFFGKALALKTLLLPIAGIALLGAAAAFVSNPVLLQLGVVSGKRRRRDVSRKYLTKEDLIFKRNNLIYPQNDFVRPNN